jgi:hypothetical protein
LAQQTPAGFRSGDWAVMGDTKCTFQEMNETLTTVRDGSEQNIGVVGKNRGFIISPLLVRGWKFSFSTHLNKQNQGKRKKDCLGKQCSDSPRPGSFGFAKVEPLRLQGTLCNQRPRRRNQLP